METLSDPDRRDTYDAMGRSSNSSGGGAGSAFNMGLFFEILFASQPAEPYVGQLSVATFFTNCMKFLTINAGDSNNITIDSIMKLFAASQTQKKQRPVQVAVHLREFIKSFVNGDMSKKEFELLCGEVAEKIADNTFGEIFLFHIGNALMQESNLFLSQSWYA